MCKLELRWSAENLAGALYLCVGGARPDILQLVGSVHAAGRYALLNHWGAVLHVGTI